MKTLPARAVIVHSAAHAAAVRQAAEKTGVGVLMLSAPHIATAGGPHYAKAMMGDTSESVIPVLDCGDDPGIIWRAGEVGWTTLLFRGPDALLDKARSAFANKNSSLPHSSPSLPHPPSSLPRRRESSPSKNMDSRFRGNDKSCVILTPSDLPTTTLDLGQTTREGDVLVEWVAEWMLCGP